MPSGTCVCLAPQSGSAAVAETALADGLTGPPPGRSGNSPGAVGGLSDSHPVSGRRSGPDQRRFSGLIPLEGRRLSPYEKN